jgi:hypothetical protein
MVIDGDVGTLVVAEPGQPLSKIASIAIMVARRRGQPVRMQVGAHSIIVTGYETAGEVAAAFARTRIRHALARREGRVDRATYDLGDGEVACAQCVLRAHLAEMQAALHRGQHSIAMWLVKLVRLSADEQVTLPFGAICDAMQAGGYYPSERRVRATTVLHADPDIIALHVIGQALHQLARGEMLSPTLAMLAEQYAMVRDRRTLH